MKLRFAAFSPPGAEFITETKINGYKQIILNKLDETADKISDEIEKSQVNNQQANQEVIRKGGKTIVRTMIPDF